MAVVSLSASHWAAANPVLARDEVGVDTTTGAFRIGDGVSPWLDLTPVAGASGDSAFYDDTQGMAALDLTTQRTLVWASGIEQVTGTDLALNADPTLIDVLTAGVYAIQPRCMIQVDASVTTVAARVRAILGFNGAGSDLDLIDHGGDDQFFNVPEVGPGTWDFTFAWYWTLRLTPGSLSVAVQATRLDSSTGTIKNRANGATEILVRKIA